MFGWTPIVVTVKAEEYESTVDPDNERLLPDDLEILRTSALSPRYTRRVGVGEIGMRSLWHQWHAIAGLCETRSIDLIFSTLPPNVSMILARLANFHFGIPYVVDYQDPWVTEVYWTLPKSQRPPKWPVTYAMSRVLEPFALRRASAVTAVSAGTCAAVKQHYPWLRAVPCTEIPFGAEPNDYEFLRAHPRQNTIFDSTDGLFHLVYAGVVTPAMHSTVRMFFAAVRALRVRNEAAAGRLKIHFIGTSYATRGAPEAVTAIARDEGVGDRVEERTRRVAYLDAAQITLEASALLILGSNEVHYTSSKLFSCALSGKPILALLNGESNAPELLRTISHARILTYGAGVPVESLVQFAARELEQMLTCAGAALPAKPAIENYTARAMTGRLAEVFDNVIAMGTRS